MAGRPAVETALPGEIELNPLLALTPTLLHHITGDRRTQLMAYLKRWNEEATLLRYLDVWLAADPGLATLRQARAEALIALDEPAPALHELDALDVERGATATRRQLRIAALIAAQDWDTLERLDPPISQNDRGDMLMAQRRYSEAKQAYATAAGLREGPPTAREVRAAIACGETARVRGLFHERQAVRGEVRPSVADLRLHQAVAEALQDSELAIATTAELAAVELAERTHLLELLGLDVHVELEVVPDVPVVERGDIAVPPEALDMLRTHWGFVDFRGGQAATISHVLDGRPALAVLPTGAGKSLTYQLPALLVDGATVVVSPLIALMKDQLDGLPVGVRHLAVAINSSLSATEVAQRLREVRAGRYRLVYVAPERLRQQPFVQALRQAGIARFVVDEAHCVSLWGLSFRPDYLFLRRVLAELGNPPVLALTATATPDTRAEIIDQLGAMDLVAASVFRSNLHFSVVNAPNADAKKQALIEQCRNIDGPILVYARARDRCEELAYVLQRAGISAGFYHAQVEDRSYAQEAFMSGRVRVLVATVAFGMGVDKPDIRAIIHYNLPQSVEAYYQEAGRAGRDGAPAQCILLYTSADKGQLTHWLREDTLDRDDLRAVYRAVRAQATHGYAMVGAEILQRSVPELDETQLRVAMGMLERVGLVVRHFDLPRTLRLTLLDEPVDDELKRFAETAQFQPGMTYEVETVALAVELGLRPDELEGALLRWAAAGVMRLESGPRDWCLELLPAPPDTPARIDGLLREYATRQDARIEAMVGYAKGLSCRHSALAAHFGERLANCRTACDICCGERTTLRNERRMPVPVRRTGPRVAEREAAHIALRTLRDLPFKVGRSGLLRILTGSTQSAIGPDRCADWGRLSAWTQSATGHMIDDLIEQGLIARVNQGSMPLLDLTDEGYTALEKNG